MITMVALRQYTLPYNSSKAIPRVLGSQHITLDPHLRRSTRQGQTVSRPSLPTIFRNSNRRHSSRKVDISSPMLVTKPLLMDNTPVPLPPCHLEQKDPRTVVWDRLF